MWIDQDKRLDVTHKMSYMIPEMVSEYQNRRRRSPFLFGSFSFVGPVDRVDNSVRPKFVFPTSLCGMIGREAELFATEGLVKPVPKIPPASLPSRLPSKTVDYLGPKLGLRKSGPATPLATRRA